MGAVGLVCLVLCGTSTGPAAAGATGNLTVSTVTADVTGSAGVPTVSLSRTTAASGQVIVVDGSGCTERESMLLTLYHGGDLTGDALGPEVGGDDGAEVRKDGTSTAELALLDGVNPFLGEGRSIEEGTYTLWAACTDHDGGRPIFAEPQRITVVGTRPSESDQLVHADGKSTFSGEGCTGGDLVFVEIDDFYDPDLPDKITRRTLTPSPDGSWSMTVTDAGTFGQVTGAADCGDPTQDGFRYVYRGIMFDTRHGSSTSTTTPADPSSTAAEPAGPVNGNPAFTG